MASRTTAGAVVLDWDESTNRPATYEYRWRTAAVGSGNPGTWRGPTTGIVATRATKTGLTRGREYDFQVRARNVFGASAYSGSQQATPYVNFAPPPAPGNVQLTLSTTLGGALNIRWSASSTATSYEYRYRTSRITAGGWTEVDVTTVGPHAITGLTNGTAYQAQVRAHTTGRCPPHGRRFPPPPRLRGSYGREHRPA